MMKYEHLMKKVKKKWKQLRFYTKFMGVIEQTDGNADKDKFLKNAIKNEDEDEDADNQDNDNLSCIDNLEKYVIKPGNSKYYFYWSIFMAITITISLFLIGYTLAFGNSLLPRTRNYETAIDVVFLIDILVKFFVGYYNDVKLITSLFRIARRYLFTFLLFDVVSTLPSLLSYQNSSIYFLKLFRFARLAHIVSPITAIVEKLSIDKMLQRQMKAFIRLMIVLFSTIHILACLWVFIGRHQDNSWIDVKRPVERFDKDGNIYIAAVYFIVVTLATVGYGDFTGNTINEYIFVIGVEFIGIGVFAMFMGQVNEFMNQASNIKDIVEDKFEDLDWWLHRLDTIRSDEKIPGPLYYSIKRFVEASLNSDFNMIIEDFDFYYKLKPSLRFELVEELFGEFIQKFRILFVNPKEGLYQEKGFTTDFVMNLYCRVYIQGQDIVKYQEFFDEMYLVKEGGISVIHVEKFGDKESQRRYMEIIELPPNSFFGEYQIVLKLKSMYIYKSKDEGEVSEDDNDENKDGKDDNKDKVSISKNNSRTSKEDIDTSTMCIKRHVLQQLLDEYPKIKEYWEEKCIERRREFRRLSLIAKKILTREYKQEGGVNNDDENYNDIPIQILSKYADELDETDFDDAILNQYEESEKIPDKSQKVKANATKNAQHGLEVIQSEIDNFNEILESHQSHFEHNLNQLSDYAKETKRNPNKSLPIPDLLLSENSPSDVLRNFINQRL